MRNTRFFNKQRLFSTQPQCCLTFSWIELQMLLRCCLIHVNVIILRHFLFSLYLHPCLDLSLLMLCLVFLLRRPQALKNITGAAVVNMRCRLDIRKAIIWHIVGCYGCNYARSRVCWNVMDLIKQHQIKTLHNLSVRIGYQGPRDWSNFGIVFSDASLSLFSDRRLSLLPKYTLFL